MMETIKKQLLAACTDIFEQISHPIVEDYFGGIPPQVFYISSGSGSFFSTDEEPVVYRFEGGQLTIADSKPENDNPVSGSYFREGHASIGVDVKKKKAYLEFVAGPLFGRGFMFDIKKTHSGYQLGTPKRVWIS